MVSSEIDDRIAGQWGRRLCELLIPHIANAFVEKRRWDHHTNPAP